MKRYYNPLFKDHIKSIIGLVHKNYELKEVSDEFELFLGKKGKNSFSGDNMLIDYYWVDKFRNNTSVKSHMTKITNLEDYEIFIVTSLEAMKLDGSS